MIDGDSLANIPRGPPGPPSEASVATTFLASSIGSVIEEKDAFLRSFTIMKDKPKMHWGILIVDPEPTKRKKKLTVGGVEGSVTLSKIQPGDVLKSINGKRIGPSFNAQRAMDLMNQRLEEDGVLSVAVGNKEGDDVLIQVTVLKPKPNMTYEEMGMTVWYWGCLCIKDIDDDSIFKHTVLREKDYIISINDIAIKRHNTAEQFARILGELPLEVTIVVLRGKQRWSGKFG